MPDILQNSLLFRKTACSICQKCEWIKAICNHIQDHHGGCSSQIDFKLRINTDHFKPVLKRHNSHRGRAQIQSLSVTTSPLIEVVQMLLTIQDPCKKGVLCKLNTIGCPSRGRDRDKTVASRNVSLSKLFFQVYDLISTTKSVTLKLFLIILVNLIPT